MLGPRYVLGSYEKKLHEMDYQKHIKRLGEIKGSMKKSNSDNKHILFRSTLSMQHTRRMEFQKSERILVIDKTNQVLLDKLVKISRNEKPPLFQPAGWSGHPGTLNTTHRKQELERIALENEAFAKRLISQNGSMNHKRLDSDFDKHLTLLKQVQKVPSPTKKDKLPPLKSPETGKSKKGLKLKKKKRSKKKALQEARTAATEGGELDTPMTQEGYNSGEPLTTEAVHHNYHTEPAHTTEESPQNEEHQPVQQETQEDENNKTPNDNNASASQEEKVPSKGKIGEEAKLPAIHRKDDKAKTELVSPRAENSKEITPKSDTGNNRGFKRSGTIQHPSKGPNQGRKLSQYSTINKPSQAKSEAQIKAPEVAQSNRENNVETEKEKEKSVEKEEEEMNKEEMKNTFSEQQIEQMNNEEKEENMNEKSAAGTVGSKVVNEKSVNGSKVVEGQSKGNVGDH